MTTATETLGETTTAPPTPRAVPALEVHDLTVSYHRKPVLWNVDLAVPPGNRLEPLAGTRSGQHSIRVNEQWRICFVWREGDAYDVEIVDYH